MSFYKIPGHEGDGSMSIATPNGTINAPIVDGIVDWPDNVPVPSGKRTAYIPAQAPEKLLEAKRQQEIEQAQALAAKLGFKLVPPDEEKKEDKKPPQNAPKSATANANRNQGK